LKELFTLRLKIFTDQFSLTWGIRKRFERGIVQINHMRFLGYDKDDDGNLIINEEQAKTIKRIYTEYLNGKGANRIAKELEADGVLTGTGKTKWYESSVLKILSNEKYKGDALLQKTYTVDFLSKKRVINNGEVPSYYVKNSHPAIIDDNLWEAVQLEPQRRKDFIAEHQIYKLDYATIENPFAGRVFCGECGSRYGRKVWNSTNERLRRYVWQCDKKYRVKGEIGCMNGHVVDLALREGFVEAYNRVIDSSYILKDHLDDQIQSENVLEKFRGQQLTYVIKSGIKLKEFNIDIFHRYVEKVIIKNNSMVFYFLTGIEIEI